jgi:hypothetical protein
MEVVFTPGIAPDASPPRPGTPNGVCLYRGQYLAKNRLTPNQRASLVIAYLDGRVDFVDLCIKQLAQICRVDVNRVQRLRHRNGGHGNGKSLAARLKAASPAERVEAARALGPDQVWDTMVLPLTVEDKARG